MWQCSLAESASVGERLPALLPACVWTAAASGALPTVRLYEKQPGSSPR